MAFAADVVYAISQLTPQVPVRDHPPASHLVEAGANRSRELGIGEDLQRLEETLVLLDRHEHTRWTPRPGDTTPSPAVGW
jgi:hypothetical protein